MPKIIIPTGIELIDLVYNGEYICNNCGAIMDRTEDPNGGCDILICPNCGEEVDEMDYEYEWEDEDEKDWDEIPNSYSSSDYVCVTNETVEKEVWETCFDRRYI